MSALEKHAEQSLILVLKASTGLTTYNIVSAATSAEIELPIISVKVTTDEELVLGSAVFNTAVEITITHAADLTPTEEIEMRRVPDPADDDTGAPGLEIAWGHLMEAVTDVVELATLCTAAGDVKFYSFELSGTDESQDSRQFSRTVSLGSYITSSLS